MKKIKAFTLIELLVVIVIIGILSAIGINQFKNHFGAAKDIGKISFLHDFETALRLESIEKFEESGRVLQFSSENEFRQFLEKRKLTNNLKAFGDYPYYYLASDEGDTSEFLLATFGEKESTAEKKMSGLIFVGSDGIRNRIETSGDIFESSFFLINPIASISLFSKVYANNGFLNDFFFERAIEDDDTNFVFYEKDGYTVVVSPEEYRENGTILPGKINGRCKNEVLSCSRGYISEEESHEDGKWSCLGLYGGTNANNCAYTPPKKPSGGGSSGGGGTTIPKKPNPINGVCSKKKYVCNSGKFQNKENTYNYFRWKCIGLHGGTSSKPSCKKLKGRRT